ncbi:MAG: cobyrinic acid a,c-diamide synthase, partial [Lachnospiraceae bacterium]|nr:cobyrinic acid a,c-diamide synthase [Lachnospiraceae bacterium]
DADPAVGLSMALGVEPGITLDDLRAEVIDQAAKGANREAVEMLGEIRFRIFDAITETEQYSFMAIGRPETAGCYCAVNAYLKNVIEMVSSAFDFVVIDGEAGIEQINRRVMEKVTHLLLVSDASKKGMGVVRSIREVADELVMYDRCGLIMNRVEDRELLSFVDTSDLELLAVIPGDAEHVKNDIQGNSIFALSGDSAVLQGAREALEKMELLDK